MKYKLKIIIPIVIAVIVVIMVVFFQLPNFSQTPADNSVSVENIGANNPYVGTYEFVGNYEYNHGEKCISQKQTDRTGWVPATLRVRVTFEPFGYGVAWDRFTVQITKIWADDPDFNTGSDGVVLSPELAKASILILPMIPRLESDPVNYAMDAFAEDKNAVRQDSLPDHHGFYFYFPSGDPNDIFGNQLGISFGREGYYISSDGREMHSYPHTPGSVWQTSDTWKVLSRTGTGPLSIKEKCSPRFLDWTFTKITP